jgi:hypothetical protein
MAVERKNKITMTEENKYLKNCVTALSIKNLMKVCSDTILTSADPLYTPIKFNIYNKIEGVVDFVYFTIFRNLYE